MKIFGLIEKINARDDGTIEVEGIASTEDRDDQNEIVTSSAIRDAIPDFMKWGAIREMHGLQAAGTALQLTVDHDKITRISAHIVDPIAILKVKNRVYKGFSIGGQVTSRNPSDSKIITGIKLNEVSLVDRPANPSAVLEMWKAGASEGEHSMSNGLGTLADTEAGRKLAAMQPTQFWACNFVEHRHLAKGAAAACMEKHSSAEIYGDGAQLWACGNPEHQHIAKASAETCIAERFAANEKELEKAKLVTVDKEDEPPLTPEEVAKRAEEGANAAQDALLEAQRAIERGEVTLVDDPPAKAAEIQEMSTEPLDQPEAVAKAGDAPGDGSKPYGDVEYADNGLQSDGKKRYPIDTADHIRSAWSYINKPKNCAKYSDGDCAKVKAKIVSAWKDKIDDAGPPSASEKASRTDIAKSLYDVSELAMLLQSLWRMRQRLEYEASVEGDESSAPAKAYDACSMLCEFLSELVAEETAEILDGEEIDEPLGMDMGPVALSAIAGSLRKSIVDKDQLERLVSQLQKAGARHNAMDQMHLNRAASNTVAAMNMDGCTKADMVHLDDVHKALIDAGATAHAHPSVGDGGGEDGLPNRGVTTHSTVDTGHKASDISLMFDALGKSGALPGSEEIVTEADALYKAGAKPHQVLANLAHGHIAAACDGATCKEGAAKPDRHSGVTMAHLHKAHFGLTKCSGAMKCDAAAAMIPGGAPNADGETEHQGTVDTSKVATVTNEGGGDLIKATAALTQMVIKLADQLEIKTSEVADLKQAAAAHEKRLDVVENQPLPPKTAASGTVAVSKQQDGGGSANDGSTMTDQDFLQHIEKMSSDERTRLLIKGAWRAPPIKIPGITDGPVPQNPRGPEAPTQP